MTAGARDDCTEDAARDAPSDLAIEKLRAVASRPTLTLPFDGASQAGARVVAAEWPVQILYGDVPFGVMMLTPDDLADFAYGFSLTEGVIERAADIRALEITPADDSIRMSIQLAGPRLQAHLARRRTLSGRTGCGVCGIEDAAALRRAGAVRGGGAQAVSLGAIRQALEDLAAHQPLNALTRAVHGAAWCGLDGRIVESREDVGRHNALDKLLGALLRAEVAPGSGFILITSRASFEMIEKAATFGVRTIVAISAPTALAIARAEALDVTLVAIARPDAVTVFHGADRIVRNAGP